MNNLECVADAIMHFEGWSVGSVSYRNRNPGNLRAGKAAIGEDSRGYAIFASLVDGYTALLTDLADKFTGHSHTGLGQDSTLLQLFEVYAPSSDHNAPERYASFVANWLTVGLQRVVSTSTRLQEVWSPDGETAISPVVTDPEIAT